MKPGRQKMTLCCLLLIIGRTKLTPQCIVLLYFQTFFKTIFSNAGSAQAVISRLYVKKFLRLTSHFCIFKILYTNTCNNVATSSSWNLTLL